MSAPLKVGDPVALVSLRFKRIIWADYRIDRETPKFWIIGRDRYRKTDGHAVPDYMNEERAIVTPEAARALVAERR